MENFQNKYNKHVCEKLYYDLEKLNPHGQLNEKSCFHKKPLEIKSSRNEQIISLYTSQNKSPSHNIILCSKHEQRNTHAYRDINSFQHIFEIKSNQTQNITSRCGITLNLSIFKNNQNIFLIDCGSTINICKSSTLRDDIHIFKNVIYDLKVFSSQQNFVTTLGQVSSVFFNKRSCISFTFNVVNDNHLQIGNLSGIIGMQSLNNSALLFNENKIVFKKNNIITQCRPIFFETRHTLMVNHDQNRTHRAVRGIF